VFIMLSMVMVIDGLMLGVVVGYLVIVMGNRSSLVVEVI